MRLLLDGHVLLWYALGNDRLAARVRDLIVDDRNEKLVGAGTLWELEIKRAAGRLNVADDLAERIFDAGFVELPIRFEHGVEAARLPRLHGDPFDRMLVAQAQVEGLTIVSADRRIARYDVSVLSA